ncbi:uncharacterized protein RCC_06759 [Ramularia collo-cygni]|uniref:Uncharacterized protein n=1 Tax=Ramularia collo-cygni TaxID=112498 RepID=A0A2D3VGA4_9PEZI|nr:uncharacterized protein RCC_06759 [Ramularia collo-cygni]CZT20899.1 uncharacterized protein RCC_06759 [Ramularia collo-cygni]
MRSDTLFYRLFGTCWLVSPHPTNQRQAISQRLELLGSGSLYTAWLTSTVAFQSHSDRRLGPVRRGAGFAP